MVTFREEGAVLEEVRRDIEIVRHSIDEGSRTTGILLAASGVLLTFLLGIFFNSLGGLSGLASSDNGSGAAYGAVDGAGTVEPLLFKLALIPPILIFGICGLLFLLALRGQVESFARPIRVLDWLYPPPGGLTDVSIMVGLIYRDSFYLETIIWKKLKIQYWMIWGIYLFYNGILVLAADTMIIATSVPGPAALVLLLMIPVVSSAIFSVYIWTVIRPVYLDARTKQDVAIRKSREILIRSGLLEG